MRALDALVAVLVLFGVALLSELLMQREMLEGVAVAVDGDTLDLRGTRLRLSGIDAPELRQECVRERRPWPCGEAARRTLAEALRRGPVSCAAGRADKYGRPLARCTVGGVDLADVMVREGMAVAYLGRDYAGAQAEAQAARRGIWAGPFEMPVDWRAANPRRP
ncbi:thermonuclease family protein [Xanthobacter sp. AM11]|uniref:thermonuclease family protein n=1 Tax=Xanthobacter sp. AM11 TaxID=3380643 RepID=UPI0039BEE0F2